MSAMTPVAPVALDYQKSLTGLDAVVRRLSTTDLDLQTPCAGWTVRGLLNHLVGELCWTPLLLGGATVADVGDRFDGDLLGRDPLGAWAAGLADLPAYVDPERPVHLSYGDVPAAEYLRQLTADYLIHAWDLASTLGIDDTLDADLVAAVGGWFLGAESGYRAAGLIGPRPPVEHDGDAQTRLLAMFGRARPVSALQAVARFSAAFDRHDLDGVMAAMTADCVFESTAPPDGVRYQGQAAVRRAWADFFATSKEATFTTEEQFECGDRVIVRWRYTWSDGFVRGIDAFRVRDGLVAEKLAYVKG
jgi:uncharacterized protein (TIGR03086 family)